MHVVDGGLALGARRGVDLQHAPAQHPGIHGEDLEGQVGNAVVDEGRRDAVGTDQAPAPGDADDPVRGGDHVLDEATHLLHLEAVPAEGGREVEAFRTEDLHVSVVLLAGVDPVPEDLRGGGSWWARWTARAPSPVPCCCACSCSYLERWSSWPSFRVSRLPSAAGTPVESHSRPGGAGAQRQDCPSVTGAGRPWAQDRRGKTTHARRGALLAGTGGPARCGHAGGGLGVVGQDAMTRRSDRDDHHHRSQRSQ